MAKTSEEARVRELLKSNGAVYVRKSGNSHEVWRLANGLRYTCNSPGRGKGKSWDCDLARLKRLLSGVNHSLTPDSKPNLTEKEVEDALAAAKARHNKLKIVPPSHPNAVELPQIPEPTPPQEIAVAPEKKTKKKTRKRRKAKRMKWTDSKEKELLQLAEGSTPHKELADYFGCTVLAISSRLAKLRAEKSDDKAATPPASTPLAHHHPLPESADVILVPKKVPERTRSPKPFALPTHYIDKGALAEDLAEILDWAMAWTGNFGDNAIKEARDRVEGVRCTLETLLEVNLHTGEE